MSVYDDDDDTQGGPAELRKALEKANKRAKDLEDLNAKLAAQVKNASLGSLLDKKNVPAHVRKWMSDVEPDEAAVDKWLAENGADFGYKPGQAQEGSDGDTATEDQTQGAPSTPSVLTPELQAALERFQEEFGNQTGEVGNTRDAVENAVAKVAADVKVGHSSQATSYEDAVKALVDAGLTVESEIGY